MISLEIDYPVIITAIGAVTLGVGSGILSCYAVLRRQSLLGDVISHATLPGICLVFYFTLSKNPFLLLMGALLAGWIGTLFILMIIRQTFLKEDTALGIVLSLFFGFGIVLLTIIQKIPTARQSGLETYLFGSAASILESDLKMMGTGLAVILVLVVLFWKEFKALSFDYNFTLSLGFPVNRLDILLTSLLVITIVIGLQTVGVILMSALIIAPGTAARQWTDHMGMMVFISVLFSVISGLIGVLISSAIPHLPTGPTIVLVISSIVVISILFSPKRGVLIVWIRDFQNRRQLQQHTILENFLVLASTHQDLTHPHDIDVLQMIGGKPTLLALESLSKQKLVLKHDQNKWGLTALGIKKAKKIAKDARS